MSLPRPHLRRRAGFTLLEVVIALGILAVSVLVLVETQAGALFMSTDADRISTATYLAEEKMMEAMLVLEQDGWTTQDIEEDGDFDDFGSEDFRGGVLRLDLEVQYEDFRWAYTVQKIDLNLPADIGGAAGDLAGNGYWGEGNEDAAQDTQLDLTDLGISQDRITELLGDYIREVRVLVWWGDNEDSVDQVELTTHVINPTGAIVETGGDPNAPVQQ
ncbi:MAG: prepilin-type N-terminal cleavage/methylation domain-containing protein [Myxococcota bacterium]|jgi:prepilin-type N-terminal cleavage/methylation domain-containing protein